MTSGKHGATFSRCACCMTRKEHICQWIRGHPCTARGMNVVYRAIVDRRIESNILLMIDKMRESKQKFDCAEKFKHQCSLKRKRVMVLDMRLSKSKWPNND